MWEFLAKLPVMYSFILLVLVVLAVVVIALKGKLIAKWGKNAIGLGTSDDSKDKNKTSNKSCPTSGPKRSCGDCVLIMMGEREKYEIKMRRAYDGILKKQMTFAEQKIIEIQEILIEMYANLYGKKKQNDQDSSPDSESVQNKLFYGLLRDALINVKDELRRSFKENGFFEHSGTEFSIYVKDKVKVVTNRLSQYMRNLYPTSKMTVETTELVDNIDHAAPKIEDIMFEIFTKAKEVKLDAEQLEKQLRTEFSEWIDKFVG